MKSFQNMFKGMQTDSLGFNNMSPDTSMFQGFGNFKMDTSMFKSFGFSFDGQDLKQLTPDTAQMGDLFKGFKGMNLFGDGMNTDDMLRKLNESSQPYIPAFPSEGEEHDSNTDKKKDRKKPVKKYETEKI